MRRALLAFALVTLAAAPAALGQGSDHPACDVPEPVRFADVGATLENLEFDGNGSLFVTAFGDGLYRLTPDGGVQHVARSDRAPPAPVPGGLVSPNAFMGVARGSDGALYVAEGHALGPPTEARVLRFPVPREPAFEVHAEGFPNANGMAADAAGNLYLAHGFRDELWKIAPDGSWDVWTRVPDVVNGIVEHPDGARLVIAPLGDAANTVLAIPLDDPDAREVLFRFNGAPSATSAGAPDPSRPAVPEGIDDLAVAPDGRVLVSSHLKNRFVMGDPATGEACVLLDGARAEPSSIRVAHGFGEWDGWAFTTDFSGDVWAIDIRPAGGEGEGEGDGAWAIPGVHVHVLVAGVGVAAALLARRR